MDHWCLSTPVVVNNACLIYYKFYTCYLIDMVEFRARSPTVVWFLPKPFGANFDPTATGLAAAWPVGPLAEFAVWRAWDDAGLLDVACMWTERFWRLYLKHKTVNQMYDMLQSVIFYLFIYIYQSQVRIQNRFQMHTCGRMTDHALIDRLTLWTCLYPVLRRTDDTRHGLKNIGPPLGLIKGRIANGNSTTL